MFSTKLTCFISFFLLCKGVLYAQPLDYFLDKGIHNSPLLNDYQNQISSASLDSMMVAASQKPQIDAIGQVTYSPTYKNFGYDEAITNGGNYSSIVGASQFIFNRKNLERKYESLNIQRRSVVNASKISTNSLKQLITDLYLTAFLDYSDIQFNKDFLSLMVAESELIHKLAIQGIYKQTDYLSILVETQTQEILLQQIQTQLDKDSHLLNQACGIEDSINYVLSLPELEQQHLPSLLSSPLFRQFKIDSMKIANEKLTIDIKYHPKLSWFADAGLNSSQFTTISRHFGYSAGINFSIPIYDGHQRRLDYQKSDLAENTRAQYEFFFKNQYNQQVQQFNHELNNSFETTRKLENQLLTAKELYSLSKTQLNSGNIPIVEFINAIKNYMTINHNLNLSKVKSLVIINELNYLMQQ